MDNEQRSKNYESAINAGYGRPTTVKILCRDTDPSASAEREDSNVKVNFLGTDDRRNSRISVWLEEPTNAILLFPISGDLGEDINGYEGQLVEVIRKSGSKLMTFELARGLKAQVKYLSFSSFDTQLASIIRYLEAVSDLDIKAIISECFKDGEKKSISGNHVDLHKLLELSDLPFKKSFGEADLFLDKDSIFDKIHIDVFDHHIGGSSVLFKLKSGNFLPPLPFPKNYIYADLSDTVFSGSVPKDEKTKFPDQYTKSPMYKAPVNLLKRQDSSWIPFFAEKRPHEAHRALNKGACDFEFHAPNVLDAVMNALFLVKAVDPISKWYFKK